MQNIGPVHDLKGLAHVVVGNQHPYSTILKVGHKITNFVDSDRIYAGKWLVEQDEMGLGRECPSDLASSPLAARKRHCRCPSQMSDRKFSHQRFQQRLPHLQCRLRDLKYCPNVLLYRETPEYRCFLRQVADPEPSTTIHREISDI